MGRKTLFALLVVFAGTLLIAAAGDDTERIGGASNQRRLGLEGVWRAELTFLAGRGTAIPSARAGGSRLQGVGGVPPIEVLFTFAPGRKKDEGTLIDSNSLQLTPNPICTQDQGVWKKTGNHSYIATHFAYCFDETTVPPGDPAGYVKVRDAITLSNDGSSFTIQQYVEGFDPSGVPNFTASGTGQATRLEVEAPPKP